MLNPNVHQAMKEDFEVYMALALEEARQSLREGNCGFGAVIARGAEVVVRAHDTEKTAGDPTAHAEITAIRQAAERLGRDLSGCALIATHEPCPMCATATLWSGIDTIAYGFSIKEALQQGRRRIDLPCREIFERAGKPAAIYEGILHAECSVLYHESVRRAIAQLRTADEAQLQRLSEDLQERRLAWFREHRQELNPPGADPLESAYRVFLEKLGLTPDDAPIIRREATRLVIHSRNFCPTLEACQILGLDTRHICARLTEEPTDALLKQIDPRLSFTRNYDGIRPHTDYCEEIIQLEEPLYMSTTLRQSAMPSLQ